MKKTSPEIAARGNPFTSIVGHNMLLVGRALGRRYEAPSFGALDPDRLIQYGLAVVTYALPGVRGSIANAVYRWSAPSGREETPGDVQGILVARKHIPPAQLSESETYTIKRSVALLAPVTHLGHLAFRIDTVEDNTGLLRQARTGLWRISDVPGPGSRLSMNVDKLDTVTYDDSSLALLRDGRVAEMPDKLIPEAVIPLVDSANALLGTFNETTDLLGYVIPVSWAF